MARTKRTGRGGGRVGQHHQATPAGLRDFEVTLASEVTIRRADGSTETVPAAAPKPARTPRRGRKPAKTSADPVPIEHVRARLGQDTPPNTGGAGAARTAGQGWTRNNSDALPRGTR